jgi:hypothetical protein
MANRYLPLETSCYETLNNASGLVGLCEQAGELLGLIREGEFCD